MLKISLLLWGMLFLTKNSHAWEWKDFKEEATSPATTDAGYVLLGGTALTLGLLAFEDVIVEPFQFKQARNQPLGETAPIGDYLGQLVPNILYVSGMTIAGSFRDPHGYDRALGMFKATLYAGSVATIFKYTTNESRPDNMNDKNSFPSGHTTTAFAFSGYIAAEHGWAWGVPALAMSTFVGYSRINDNRHWLHDVTAGATVGWVYGWGVSKVAKRRKKEEKNEENRKEVPPPPPTILPIADSKTVGLVFMQEF